MHFAAARFKLLGNSQPTIRTKANQLYQSGLCWPSHTSTFTPTQTFCWPLRECTLDLRKKVGVNPLPWTDIYGIKQILITCKRSQSYFFYTGHCKVNESSLTVHHLSVAHKFKLLCPLNLKVGKSQFLQCGVWKHNTRLQFALANFQGQSVLPVRGKTNHRKCPVVACKDKNESQDKVGFSRYVVVMMDWSECDSNAKLELKWLFTLA